MKVKVFRQIFTTKDSKEPYRKASGMKPCLPTRRYNQQPGPEGSLVKWLWSDTNQRLTELAVDIIGPEALTAGTSWSYEFLRARGNTIEGGTTEVLKNIVAERVLGLPRLKVAT